jgi:hypothetical protein
MALDAASVSVTTPFAARAANSKEVVRAGGRADVNGTPVQNILHETYSFTALAIEPRSHTNGQVQVDFAQFTGERFKVHARVTCVSTVGNAAWIGSEVTRFVVDGVEQPERIGGPMIFRVQDMGEGQNAADSASLVFFGVPAGGDLTYCSTRPAFPLLFQSMKGNIQVKP